MDKKLLGKKRGNGRINVEKKEMEKDYNRNEWEIIVVESLDKEGNFEKELRRKRDVQRHLEEHKIREAKYNKKYKELSEAMIRLRYVKKKKIEKQ